MKCYVCGGEMRREVTDLPFKLDNHRILVVKNLPVEQCCSCREYLIEDRVMQDIESMIDDLDQAAELEVRQYAA